MKNKTFTAEQGTRVFYLKDGKHEAYTFETGKLDIEEGQLQEACMKHPKVLEVASAQIQAKPGVRRRRARAKVEEPKAEVKEVVEEVDEEVKEEETAKKTSKK